MIPLLSPAVVLLLLLGLPLAEAVLCLALRYQPLLATSLAAGTLILDLAAVLDAPDMQVTVLGLSYRFDGPRRLVEAAFILTLLALLALDRLVGQGRKFAAVTLALAGAGGGVVLIADPRVGAGLLLGMSAAVLFALLDRPLDVTGAEHGLGAFRIAPWPGAAESDLPGVPALDAALKYLALMVLAAVALGIAFVLLDRYRLEPEQGARLKLVLGFLTVGLGLRLGAAPLHAWVSDLVAAPPAAAGLALVALNGLTVFYAAQVLAGAPMILLANPLGRELLLAGAAGGVILAALLAWSPAAQGDLRRLAGAVAVGQAGFTLFGLVTPSLAGFCGALVGTLAGGAGLLLALGAAGLIAASAGTADPAALAGLARQARLPVAALALGLLAALGLPPLGAFAGRLLVFQAAMARDAGWPWVAVLAGGLALLTVAVFRALAPLWLTRAEAAAPQRAAPTGTGLWLALLAGVCLVLGLLPAPLFEVARAWAATIPYITGP